MREIMVATLSQYELTSVFVFGGSFPELLESKGIDMESPVRFARFRYSGQAIELIPTPCFSSDPQRQTEDILRMVIDDNGETVCGVYQMESVQ